MLNLLADEYPDVYRFTTAVFPSADDDVITSPYNRYLHYTCQFQCMQYYLPTSCSVSSHQHLSQMIKVMVFLPVNNQDFINPLTLMSEQDGIFPYNKNT